MRIPSQFSEDSLYRRGKRRHESNHAGRRIFRLLVAAVLIVVVMRQAAHKELYEPFFAPAAVSSAPSTTAGSGAQPAAFSNRENQAAPATDALARQREAALAEVADGTTWRAADFAAFYLLLREAQASDAAADAESDADAATGADVARWPLVSVVPMLQQPRIYRGAAVRVRGDVARVQQKSASANDEGIESYWEIWLRPDDGSERPILAIVPSVPARVGALAGLESPRRGTGIVVAGRMLKRLAYRSAAGVELTPVVIGSILDVATEAAEPAVAKAGNPDRRALIWVAFAASLLGVSLAAYAMWRTSTDAKRLRRLRSAGTHSLLAWSAEITSRHNRTTSPRSAGNPATPQDQQP